MRRGQPEGPSGARRLRQGSPQKRAAIVQAALEVFVREGYARASVDTIAAEATVSKRTIYDYFGDKKALFLSVIEETSAAQNAAFHQLLSRTLNRDADIETGLIAFGREFAAAMVRSPERSAVLRLIGAEAAHFPELTRYSRGIGPVQQALAERLAQFADDGVLDLPDPVEAAEILSLLVTGRVLNRSLSGAIDLADDEIEQLVSSGVQIFLRAYRPGTGSGSAQAAKRSSGGSSAG
ncbi:MAG: TetR/AcrR family transcriptional regulator [Pseudonocardiaceae bacterium]